MAVEKLTYDVPEAAAALGVATSTLYEWLQANGVESIKIGKRRLISRDVIHKLLNMPTSTGPDPVEFAKSVRIAELEMKKEACEQELNVLRGGKQEPAKHIPLSFKIGA